MAGKVSSYFWREVDLTCGAFEMFADPRWTGVRQTIFLSEWADRKTISIGKWYMNDRMSSIRWATLNEDQYVEFWEHPYGEQAHEGRSLTDLRSLGNDGIPWLGYVNFDDYVSSFKWILGSSLSDKYEPIKLTLPTSFEIRQQAAQQRLLNDSDEAKVHPCSWNLDVSTPVLISTTDKFIEHISASIEVRNESNGTFGSKPFASLLLGYRTGTEPPSKRGKKFNVEVKCTYDVPTSPHATTMTYPWVDLAKIPDTVYETYVTRWYTANRPGSEIDDSRKHGNIRLYRRREKTSITLSGHLVSRLGFDYSLRNQLTSSEMKNYEGKRVRTPAGHTYLVVEGLARSVGGNVYKELFGEGWPEYCELLPEAAVWDMPKGPAFTTIPPLIIQSHPGGIHLVDDGKKRLIANPETFNGYGFDWNRVKVVGDGIGKYPDGEVLRLQR